MTSDLALLTTAAEEWDKAAKDFEKVQKAYNSQVRNVAIDGSWTGVARTFAEMANKQTYEQFTAAAKEARALASLLRDAHAQFTDLRGKLKAQVAKAEAAGMKMSDDGTARFDFEKADKALANAARHDPDLHTTESSWTKSIGDLVQAFDDADQGVKLALSAAVQDTDKNDNIDHSFNAKAEGDIEKVEGRRQAELARLTHWDDKQLAEMQRLFRDNAKNKEFSQTLLDSLGPRETLFLSNRLNEAMDAAGESSKPSLGNIEKGLATSLATATRSPDPAFYDKWREGIRKVGTEVAGSRQKVQVRGYQSLLTLMSQGSGFSTRFVTDLGDDIIAAEKGHHGIWDMPSGKNLAHPPRWLATDPLDSLLGIAARDPKTAEAFLDPGPDGKNDRLKYLVHDRDWKNRYELTGNYSHPDADQFRKVEDPNARKGLASAIEAAATGQRAEDTPKMGAVHTEGQARVMQGAVEALNGKFGDKLPENLRSPIARAIVDYAPDTHEILTGQNPRYGYEGGLKNPWTKDGDSHLAVDQQSLVRVIRGVSDDPKNFSLIYNTERAYSADVLAKMPDRPSGANTDWNVPSRDVGMAFGALNAVGADAIMDTQDARKAWADDVARYGYHLGGAPVTGLPLIGDVAQRTIDAAAYDWSKDIKNLADEKARGELAKDWTKDTASVKDLIDASAKVRHLDPTEPQDPYYNDVKQMRQEAEQSYAAGRNKALAYLRPN
ncbi:hypothetical protein [Streptomyces roseoverticillatus]|uniref:hypothetical protein n=1 Tax=Streptomyces roseoverticillatus TaxID=66429 RepID=UPI0012FE9CC5|nr:hypothetical protein [Streptomyces roseoverticillatus]